MKIETMDKFKNIFDKYDKKQYEAQKEKEKIETERKIFLENYHKIIAEVIIPTIEDFSGLIKSRGHDFLITQEKETYGIKGSIKAAQVKIEIYPNGNRPSLGRPGDCPQLTFFAGIYDNKVFSYIRTMMPGQSGYSGKTDDYELKNITDKIVKEELIHLLDESFGK
ncbi:MAG: hypothetical protein KKG88_11005 [Proteobacteria bacterium]|nr:hypothetical protein [Pseudomonadota bacterium]